MLRCGFLLYKYKTMKKIEYLRSQVKRGKEIYSLSSENLPHPSYLQYNDYYFVKSGIVMHIVESRIQKDHYHKLLKILVRDCTKKHCSLSSRDFKKKFKRLCGFNPKMLYNWVDFTGALDITIKYTFSKKNNNINLIIDQRNIFTYFLARSKMINSKKADKTLNCHNLYSKDYVNNFDEDQYKEEYTVESRREALRWFQDSCSLFMYETDGSTIKPEQHKLELNFQKPQIKLTIPLKNKVRKTNQNKKKDYHYGPAIGSDQWKFQPSDSVRGSDGAFYKSEIFKLRNLECSLLWVRIDPELEFIRKVNIEQEEDNWHYQLLKEKDIIGQYEAIHALKKYNTEAAYEALKHVILNKEYFFKIRQQALKAITEMNTKEFNKFLSTEKFLIKIFNEYDMLGHPKYRANQLQYFVDKALVRCISTIREGSTIQNLAEVNDYELKMVKSFSTKDLNKFLLELVKKHYSSKLLFDDSYYIANIIKAMGNIVNMKTPAETVTEIIRQAKVDLARSMSLLKQVMGSYNNLVLKACIVSLTTLYENLKILHRQLIKNSSHRKKHKGEDEGNKKSNIHKQMNKAQIELDAKTKIKRQLPIIESFMSSIPTFPIYHKVIDLQVLYYRYQITKIFTTNKFMVAFYQSLSLVNDEIDNERSTTAVAFLRNLREYLEERIYRHEDINYCEIFDLDSPRTKAIYEILWEMLTLEFTFLHSEFKQEVQTLLWMFYRDVGLRQCPIDENWKNLTKVKSTLHQIFDDKSHADIMSASGRRRHADYDSELMSDHYSTHKYSQDRRRGGKNIIKLKTFQNITDHSLSKIGESLYKSELSLSDHRSVKRGKYYDRDDTSYIDNQSQLNIVEEEDYDNMDWKDCCLKVLDRIEEYDESEDFKKPVTKEDLGEFWEDYRSIITYPIDLTSIRAKIYDGDYAGVGNFEFDMRKVFDNCKKFNDPNSQIYENANTLEDVFNKLFKPVKKKFGESKKLKEAGIKISVGGIGI